MGRPLKSKTLITFGEDHFWRTIFENVIASFQRFAVFDKFAVLSLGFFVHEAITRMLEIKAAKLVTTTSVVNKIETAYGQEGYSLGSM